MNQLFLRIYHYFEQHRRFLFLLMLPIVVLCVFGIMKIDFQEDISNFLPQNKENERINFAYQHVGATNKIVVHIGMADTAQKFDQNLIIAAVDTFVNRIQTIDTVYIKKIDYKVDQEKIWELTEFITQNLPYFLTENDYLRMDSLIQKEVIYQQLNNNKQLLSSLAGLVVKKNIIADPLHLATPALIGLKGFQMNDSYKLCDDYIFNKKGTEAVINISSQHPISETNFNRILIEQIDKEKETTQKIFNNSIRIDCIGASYAAITNAQQIKRDSYLSIGLAVVFILLILFYFFRNFKSIVLIVVSLLFGAAFSIAVLSVFKESVSVIAIGMGSVIIGIAANYPLHYLAHCRQGYSNVQTLKDIVSPLTIGNITTVGAFLSLLFIRSEAMRDLGYFAALLLIGTIAFVLIFLPHLLRKQVDTNINEKFAFGKLAHFSPEKHKWLVWSICILTVVFYFFGKETQFETNMQNINYMTSQQRQLFQKLMDENETAQHTLYCVSEGVTMDEALKNYEKTTQAIDQLIQNDGVVSKKTGIGNYIPSQAMQQKRLQRWNEFWSLHKADVIENLNQAATELEYKTGAFAPFEMLLNRTFEVHDIDFFSPIIQSFADNYMVNTENRSMVFTILHAKTEYAADLEEQLNKIDNQTFVFDSGSITNKMVEALSFDFDFVLYICGCIVFLFLTLSLGRIELSLLSFLPLAIGWIWILGIMGLCDIRFNIINIILATFIFGQGDDYTIFVTEGLMYEYAYKKKILASYKNAVILSAIIMFIGIGTLIFAQHPAMKSLGEVTIIGMVSVVMMAYIFPPLIFKSLTMKKGKQRMYPVTLKTWLATFVSFSVFILGCLYLTIAGIIIIGIGGKTAKNKYRFHKRLHWISFNVFKILPLVKTTFHNKYHETFEKPAVIISNHQSHLDLMCMLGLTPKLVIITNTREWKSPFYGLVLRFAEFCPIDNGIENNIHHLAKLIQDGYSVVIFPEGTRSEDCSILRFHRGAFYLAEQLQLDILPVMLHGVGHVLPKTERLLRSGKIDVHVLKRIISENDSYGINYVEKSRNIRKMYVAEYEHLCEEIEDVAYFKDLVLHNFVYKGADIYRQASRNFKIFDNYKMLLDRLQKDRKLLIINCGQGEFSLLCSLIFKKLDITATDKDSDALTLAQNCISNPKNLTYREQVGDYSEFSEIVALNPDNTQLSQIASAHISSFIVYQGIEQENCLAQNEVVFQQLENRSKYKLYYLAENE